MRVHACLALVFVTVSVIVINGDINACENDTSSWPKVTFDGHEMDETFYQMTQLRQMEYPNIKGRKTLIHLIGNRECPHRGSGRNEKQYSKEIQVLNEHLPKYLVRSSCPAYLAINHDENRKPSILVEAVCTCKTCGTSKRLRCQPISYFRRVIRRECNKETKLYEYFPSVEAIPIGCTCMEKRRN